MIRAMPEKKRFFSVDPFPKYSSFHDGIPDICLSGVEFVGLKLRLCKFDYKYQVYLMNAP